jgi:hypothetical protein
LRILEAKINNVYVLKAICVPVLGLVVGVSCLWVLASFSLNFDHFSVRGGPFAPV